MLFLCRIAFLLSLFSLFLLGTPQAHENNSDWILVSQEGESMLKGRMHLTALMLLFGMSSILLASGMPVVPQFPLQFSANLTITAHLIEEESTYPPRVRRMSLYYDYLAKRARADLEAGYEAAKIYVRRYDLNSEYMVRLPPIGDCKRAHLGEVMPFPQLPSDFDDDDDEEKLADGEGSEEGTKHVGTEMINGILCNYFLHVDYETRVHMYLAVADNAPVRLLQETSEGGVDTPMLTYDYSDVRLAPPDETLFDVPAPFTHEQCERHVGGFPYLHVYHYFVKF